MTRKLLRKILLTLLTGLTLLSPSAAASNPSETADTACRFGITSVAPLDGYDLNAIKVGSYLDWAAVNNPPLPEGLEYIRVLRLRDNLYPATLANLPTWVADNPGSVWIVGNEPDTTYNNQDALLPETYADRYYQLATIIRQLDRTAQIAFGPVVQPTPIRIRYLQRAWDRLAVDAGSYAAASALVDLWSPHSFILNERPNDWGTGVPPGFANDHDDAVTLTFSDTYRIDIFEQRIFDFRDWMASIGERDKPVWITEYGSLLPPIDPPGINYPNVSDELTSAFMLDTFDFLLNTANPLTGLPADGNQLVQRWYWYSLNDHRYHYGGTLFNPDYPAYPYTGPYTTTVGQAYIDYQSNLPQPDLSPIALSIAPISYAPGRTLVNYRIDVQVANGNFADATCARLWIYDGHPAMGGTLIAGPIPASAFHANFNAARVNAYWMGVQPFIEHQLYVDVEPVVTLDSNPDDNWGSFSVYPTLPWTMFHPIAVR